MKAFVLAAAIFFAVTAKGELYRWIDPDTGSVKYSTIPPYDPRINAEVVPFRATAAPAAAPASAAVAVPAQSGAVAALEARWSDLLRQLSGLTPQDFSRAGSGVMQQLEAYGTLTAELDRLDPAGSQRRRSQSEPFLERLQKGLGAQPGQQKK